MTPNDAHLLKALYDSVAEQADEYERTWGVDRLPRLVPPELRARFMAQLEKWNEALRVSWAYEDRTIDREALEHVKDQATRMGRAWAALDRKARELCAEPLKPEVWEIALDDGTVAVFARDLTSAAAVMRAGRAVTVWTPQEVANLIKALPELLMATKHHFPGATVIPGRKRVSGRMFDEEVPF